MENMNKETETPDQPATDSSEINPNRMRVVSMALLDAAMRYREGHYREDTKVLEGFWREAMISEVKAKLSVHELPSTRKKQIEKIIEKKVKTHIKEQEAFGKKVYGYIDSITANMSKDAQVGFDNYATAFGILADNLEKAKNTTQLLTMVQMYNNGSFDEMFDKIDADRKKEGGNV